MANKYEILLKCKYKHKKQNNKNIINNNKLYNTVTICIKTVPTDKSYVL